MKRNKEKLMGRFCCKLIALLTIFLVISPVSTSVLCVGPGGHVAIEDINSPCCTSSSFGASLGRDPGGSSIGDQDCRDCTDLFISQAERGAIPESHHCAATGSNSNECFGDCLLAIIASHRFVPEAFAGVDESPYASSSIPLRC